MKVFLRLLPKGKYAAMGFYDRFSCRHLQFDIRVQTKEARNYITLEKQAMVCIAISGATHKGGVNCQNIDAIPGFRDRVPPSKLKDFDRLMRIWREYHLNDWTAGTFAQEKTLKEWRCPRDHGYEAACKYLEARGLLVDKGYRYGTGWLCKPLPPDDIAFLMKLHTLWGDSFD